MFCLCVINIFMNVYNGNEEMEIMNVTVLCCVRPGPNFIALLTGKQIFVLTIAENFA